VLSVWPQHCCCHCAAGASMVALHLLTSKHTQGLGALSPAPLLGCLGFRRGKLWSLLHTPTSPCARMLSSRCCRQWWGRCAHWSGSVSGGWCRCRTAVRAYQAASALSAWVASHMCLFHRSRLCSAMLCRCPAEGYVGWRARLHTAWECQQ
jgi:hypothetical protein